MEVGAFAGKSLIFIPYENLIYVYHTHIQRRSQEIVTGGGAEAHTRVSTFPPLKHGSRGRTPRTILQFYIAVGEF